MTNEKAFATNAGNLAAHQQLCAIGLSKLGAECYVVLWRTGLLEVSQLAKLVNRPYRSVHRVIRELQQRGFARHVYTGFHPYKYEAVLLGEALLAYGEWQNTQVQALLRSQQELYFERQLVLLRRR